MTAQILPSRVDGRPAIVIRYPPDARWPHHRVNDEPRPLDERTLLGLSFGLPLAPRGGAPFILHRQTPHADGAPAWSSDGAKIAFASDRVPWVLMLGPADVRAWLGPTLRGPHDGVRVVQLTKGLHVPAFHARAA